MIKNKITSTLGIEFPLFMAPMFLASNEMMMKSAIRNGICGIFPTLNFLNTDDLEQCIIRLNNYIQTCNNGTYGVNIVIQPSNIFYKKHLDVCAKNRVPFYTTSLGNPIEVIKQAHSYNAIVYCDVTNLKHAEKCLSVGCDGFVAVCQGAGGHAGSYPLHILIPALKNSFPNMPVIAAGGVADGKGFLSALSVGADGVAMGTRFLASDECAISYEYKQAIVKARINDIVMSERISGTPNSIINTPFAKKIGLKANWIEKLIMNNSFTKKYFRAFVQKKGMKMLEKSIIPGNYQNLWIAGQSVEMIHDIKSCDEIIQFIKQDIEVARTNLNSSFC